MIRLRVTPKPRPLDYSKLSPEAHIRSRDVAHLTGYADEYVRRKAKREPDFPQPIENDEPGPRFWRLGDVLDYLKAKGRRVA